MDLTPEKSSSTKPWWSVFDCCRPPPSSSSSSAAATTAADERDDNGYYGNDEFAAAPYMYSIKIATEGLDVPQTPGTSCSDDSADSSLEFGENDLVEENDDVSTPPGVSRVVRKLEDEFIVGEIDESLAEDVAPTSTAPYSYETPERKVITTTVETNGPCEACALDEPEGERDDDDIPDVDFPLTKPPSHVKNSQDQVETKFYQFMFLMMMRHVFGNLLSGTNLDPATKLLSSQCSDDEEELSKRMSLRRLHFSSQEGREESSREVVSQLSSEEGA